MIETTQFFLIKAEESLRGAQSELVNHRYNNSANRSYYSCFQAAISALLRHSVRPSRNQWGHQFVHGEFVGTLVNRRKLFPSDLRSTLSRNLIVRQRADYEDRQVSGVEAERALRRTQEFLVAIRGRGGEIT